MGNELFKWHGSVTLKQLVAGIVAVFALMMVAGQLWPPPPDPLKCDDHPSACVWDENGNYIDVTDFSGR